MNYEELGFTQEELQSRVIQKICDELLTKNDYDNDEECSCITSSNFKIELQKQIASKIDERLAFLFDKEALPKIENIIDNYVIQETNGYGEAKKEPKTLTEYCVSKAEMYIKENVDSGGKKSTGYSSRNDKISSRAEYLLNKALDNKMKGLVEEAIQAIKKAIEGNLAEEINARVTNAIGNLKANLRIS